MLVRLRVGLSIRCDRVVIIVPISPWRRIIAMSTWRGEMHACIVTLARSGVELMQGCTARLAELMDFGMSLEIRLDRESSTARRFLAYEWAFTSI
jgi:hypothetical protein